MAFPRNMNQGGPFWDFLSSLQEQAANNPNYSADRRGPPGNVEAGPSNPWEAWGFGPFGPMPHRGRHAGGPHHRGPPGPHGPSQEYGRHPPPPPPHAGERHGSHPPPPPPPEAAPIDPPSRSPTPPTPAESVPGEHEYFGPPPPARSGGHEHGGPPHNGPHGRHHGGPRGGPRSGFPHHSGPHGGPHGHPHSGPRGGPHGYGHGHGHGRRGGPPLGGPPHRGSGGFPFDPQGFDLHSLSQLFQSHLFPTTITGGGSNINTNKHADGTFTPNVDIFDTSTAYILHASLPGAKKSDLSVSYNAVNHSIQISGVIARPAEVDEDMLTSLAQDERQIGLFEREIKLGEDVKIDVEGGISAKLEDGVLRVEVLKEEVIDGWTEVKKVDIE